MTHFFRFAFACFASGLVAAGGAAALLEVVLVEARAVLGPSVAQWKSERFNAVAVALDERTGESLLRNAAKEISAAGLDQYYWVEVARNPEMAGKNPRWMAALGSHSDWQKNFPQFPEPGIGEVAKAFPWVP